MSHAASAGGNYKLWAARPSRPAAVETKTRASAAMLRKGNGRTDQEENDEERQKREVAESKRSCTKRLANAMGKVIKLMQKTMSEPQRPTV